MWKILTGRKSKKNDMIHAMARHQTDNDSEYHREIGAPGTPEEVGPDKLGPNDIVIAVMGPTGSGKSTFVRHITGRESLGVGHGLKSHTNQVSAVRFWDQKSGRFVVLVDTPGFDDTLMSDLDILDMISRWLASSYGNKKLLSGILYLHRITDNRMAGTPLRNLRVFRKLCGKDALDKVYLTTTMWDEVGEVVGEKRLEELRRDYWKTMIEQGARIARCKYSDGSAEELIRRIIYLEMLMKNDAFQRRMSTPKLLVAASRPHTPVSENQPRTDKEVAQTVSQVFKDSEQTRSTKNLEADDLIIAVLGPLGSGKSTFVRKATRYEHGVRYGSETVTSRLDAVRFWDQASKRHIVLLDTPGFDDTHESRHNILNMISEWLTSSYDGEKLVSGILYLQPVTDKPLTSTSLENFDAFEKLCGNNAADKVYITTTMWENDDPVVGEMKLDELKGYWQSMTNQGPHIACWHDDASAKRLVRQIICTEQSKRNERRMSTLQPPADPGPSQVAERRPHKQLGEKVLAAEVMENSLGTESTGADDIIIALLGLLGPGKSALIRRVTGLDSPGQMSESNTSGVLSIRFWDRESGRFVVLADVPCFDGPDIWKAISGWLASRYDKTKLFSGILYLQSRADDSAMGTVIHDNDALDSIRVSNTMSSEIESGIRRKELDRLKTGDWKTIITAGATIVPCVSDDDASRLIRQIIDGEKSRESNPAPTPRATLPPQPSTEPSSLLGRDQRPQTDKQPIQADPAPVVVDRVLNVNDPEDDDIVIAVMGPTDSVKSMFIRNVTGPENSMDRMLASHTSGVLPIRFLDEESGRFIVLVDTPGFDDMSKPDLDILSMVSDWLALSYGKRKPVSGILYLQPMTDSPLESTLLENPRAFRKLCGKSGLDKVYLIATMWDEADGDAGEKKFDQLKTNDWKTMIDHGAQTTRCGIRHDTPRELVQRIVAQETPLKGLLIQEEMVKLKKELKETAAGQQLYSHLEKLVEKQTDLLRRINKEKKAATDPGILRELQVEYDDIRAQIDDKLRQMQELKVSLLKRFLVWRRD